MNSKKKLLALVFVCIMAYTGNTQIIGDVGWEYDSSGKVSDNFEARQEQWAIAGVQGGIRHEGSGFVTINAGTGAGTINKKIKEISDAGGGRVQLKNGTYNIKSTINMRKNVVLEGESRTGVLLIDKLSTNGTTTNGAVIKFDDVTGHTVGGIRNMTLRGPFTGTPGKYNMTNARPNANNIMINIVNSDNIFVDNVTVLNSGGSPVSTFKGSHLTVRNSTFEGCWNKGQGGAGYFAIQSAYCLVFGNTIRYLRHFAIQKLQAEYNVVFKNYIEQDVNFHNEDGGNNLVEDNTINITFGLSKAGGSTRYSVMGPWSATHNISNADNFIYANTIQGYNKRCTDNSRVYKGARVYEANVGSKPNGNPFSSYSTVGTGLRFYSVKNGTLKSKISSEKNEVEVAQGLFKIHPNPINRGQNINITLPNTFKHAEVHLYDTSGRMVYNHMSRIDNNTLKINLNQPEGLYVLLVKSGDEVLRSKLVVK